MKRVLNSWFFVFRCWFPVLGFVLAGCAHVARHYNSPDHTKLTEASARLNNAVVELKAASVKVTNDLKVVRTSHAHEAELLGAFDGPLDNLVKVAPANLLPQIRSIQAEVAALKTSQADTEIKLAALMASQVSVDEIAARADKAAKDVEQFTPEYLANVDKIVGQLNADEQAWHKDSAEIVSLRMGSIFTKILAVLGSLLLVAAIVGVVFLHVTGRMAQAAKAVGL